MLLNRLIARLAVVSSLFLIAARVEAANRIYVKNQTAKVGGPAIEVPVYGETDKERNGFSLSIKYDQTKLTVTEVTVAGTAADGAEWTGGRIVSESGAVSYGVVLDLSDPLTKVLPLGSDFILVKLKINVVATAATTTPITPQNGLGTPEGSWKNLFSFQGTGNVLPELSGGTLTIESDTQPGNKFLLGDCNADEKPAPDVSDAVFILSYLFTGGTQPICEAACNVNGDAAQDVSDAVFLLGYLFLGGETPAPPFPACGSAPSEACGADICGI